MALSSVIIIQLRSHILYKPLLLYPFVYILIFENFLEMPYKAHTCNSFENLTKLSPCPEGRYNILWHILIVPCYWKYVLEKFRSLCKTNYIDTTFINVKTKMIYIDPKVCNTKEIFLLFSLYWRLKSETISNILIRNLTPMLKNKIGVEIIY